MAIELPRLLARMIPGTSESLPEGVRIAGVFLEGDALVHTGASKPFSDVIEARKTAKRFSAKAGENFIVEGDSPVLVLGLGEKKDFTVAVFREALVKAADAVCGWAARVVLDLEDCRPDDVCPKHFVRSAADVLLDACTPRIDFKTEDKKEPAEVEFVWVTKGGEEIAAGIEEGRATAYAKRICRWLADLPANIATPAFLGEAALRLGETFDNLEVTVMGLEEIRSLGMGCFLAVAQGSVEEPRFIAMRYRGADEGEPLKAIVGKGITFDAGGISLKPAAGMWDMTYDMCGAASVIGTMAGLASLKAPVNVIGVVAACENLPSGSAVKPGDVVTSLSGRTVEILNTDAEGRLILADALTWTLRQKPSLIVDMATLTGACCVALGAPYSGLFSNSDALADALVKSGRKACDPLWRLPVGPEYLKLMKSVVADISNISCKREGGASTAAAFLETFVGKETPWAHLDIAATANEGNPKRRATGRPVGALMHFLVNGSCNLGDN